MILLALFAVDSVFWQVHQTGFAMTEQESSAVEETGDLKEQSAGSASVKKSAETEAPVETAAASSDETTAAGQGASETAETQSGETGTAESSGSETAESETSDSGQQLFEQKLQAVIYDDESYSTESADDMTIEVDGLLPEDCSVKAYPVSTDEDVNGVHMLCAYDISIFDKDGSSFEPDKGAQLQVSFSSKELKKLKDKDKSKDLSAYYIPDKGDPKKIDSEAKDGSVQFDAEHFSTYAVGTENGFLGLQYAFYDSDTTTNITLNTDITIPAGASLATVVSGKNITLDLNGHKITQASGTTPFNISGGTLIIKDSQQPAESVTADSNTGYGIQASKTDSNGSTTLDYYVTKTSVTDTATGSTSETLEKHSFTTSGEIIGSDQPIFNVTGGTLEIQSGMLSGIGTNRAITMNGGNLNLTGGYICGFAGPSDATGTAAYGGAIYAVNASNITLAGTVLAGNQADSGGAIYMEGSTLAMTGGVISGNQATKLTDDYFNSGAAHYGGGGIYADGSSVIDMSGGYISNNRANSPGYFDGGGGALIAGTTKFTLSGGYITNNFAVSGGGGVRTYWENTAAYTMTGGFVTRNAASTAEGGGVSINLNSKGYITGGHITNNKVLFTPHWGGGGLFCSAGGQLYIKNVLVTNNSAGGFGGGVAGCSTGRLELLSESGSAIYGNTANGTQCSGTISAKSADRTYGLTSSVFMNNGYADYFCALNSTVSGKMLGGGSANWSGSVDGVPVRNVSAGTTLTSNSIIGLTADPTDSAITNAQNSAGVYINGNSSYTHGGGILCNGYLVIGSTDKMDIGSRIELTAKKALYDSAGSPVTLTSGEFKFQITNESGAVVALGKNGGDYTNDSSEITFDRRLAFDKAGTYKFYMSEVADPANKGIINDTSVYRITATVEQTPLEALTGPDNTSIARNYYKITSVLVEKQNGDSWSTVYTNSDPDCDEEKALSIDLSGSGTFTNYEVSKTSVTAIKKWQTTDTHPSSVTVRLMRNDSVYDTQTLSSSNNWTYKWTDLPTKSDDGNTNYSYTVKEDAVTGYSASYSTSTQNEGNGAWVPATSLTAGNKYIIVGNNGQDVLKITPAHRDSAFDSSDQKSVSKSTGSLTVNGTTYSSWYTADQIDSSCIFVPELHKTNGYDSATAMIMYNKAQNSSLLVQNSDGNYLKGGSNKDYSSAFQYYPVTYNGITYPCVQGQEEWGSGNEWRYIVYSGGKFTSDTSLGSIGANLYTWVEEPAMDSVVTITNTPAEQARYKLDITKVDKDRTSLELSGAVFQLYDQNDQLVHFTGADGIYSCSTSGTVTDMTTVTYGKLALSDLPAGTYTLHESLAPSGYNTAADRTVVLPDTSGTDTVSLQVADESITADYVLPANGGEGIIPFIITGTALMAVSLLYVCIRRGKRGRRGLM